MAKKKTAKKPTSTSASKKTVLTADQQKRIRKLLKSKGVKNIKLAIGLLQSTDATTDDWSQSFSSTVISQLVNTWDWKVWTAVAAGLHPFSGLLKEFMDLAAERFQKLSGWIQDSFMLVALSKCEKYLQRMTLPVGDYPKTEIRALATGLRHIALAESFIKHKGTLYLDGHGTRHGQGYLTSLSDAAAESLSKHRGILSLGGLTTLSDAAAEFLGKHKGTLCLDGLTSLSDAAAESLSKHKGFARSPVTATGCLSLCGLTSLSDAAAESLSKRKGKGSLSLDGLTSLSDAAAESLSKHEGKGSLSLCGLTSLSDAAAESLSMHEGELYITLDNLPASAVQFVRLAGHMSPPLYMQ